MAIDSEQFYFVVWELISAEFDEPEDQLGCAARRLHNQLYGPRAWPHHSPQVLSFYYKYTTVLETAKPVLVGHIFLRLSNSHSQTLWALHRHSFLSSEGCQKTQKSAALTWNYWKGCLMCSNCGVVSRLRSWSIFSLIWWTISNKNYA